MNARDRQKVSRARENLKQVSFHSPDRHSRLADPIAATVAA
jgi:hypothetical protein